MKSNKGTSCESGKTPTAPKSSRRLVTGRTFKSVCRFIIIRTLSLFFSLLGIILTMYVVSNPWLVSGVVEGGNPITLIKEHKSANASGLRGGSDSLDIRSIVNEVKDFSKKQDTAVEKESVVKKNLANLEDKMNAISSKYDTKDMNLWAQEDREEWKSLYAEYNKGVKEWDKVATEQNGEADSLIDSLISQIGF